MSRRPSVAAEQVKPRLVGRSRVAGHAVIVSHGGVDHALEPSGIPPRALGTLLARIDGTRSLRALAAESPALDARDLEAFVRQLDAAGLIDDDSAPRARDGFSVMLELEDLTRELCERTLDRNVFWTKCLRARRAGDLPWNVVVGTVIENYHFLFRESYFDAPVLSFVPNTAVRLTMNRFYAEEYGHDEILLRALETAGISRADLADTMPLPATMALCNSLAYWAHNDPLFFFTTLGLLEGQGVTEDSFIQACERIGVDAAFIKPLRAHAEINRRGGHGNLTRRIFHDVRAIDDRTVARLRAQTRLFVELYDAFYTNVWEHYSTSPRLLRRISEL